jgi:hypothetical protein
VTPSAHSHDAAATDISTASEPKPLSDSWHTAGKAGALHAQARARPHSVASLNPFVPIGSKTDAMADEYNNNERIAGPIRNKARRRPSQLGRTQQQRGLIP